MKTKLYLLFFFVFPLFMSACRGDDPIPDPPVDGKRTVLVYMAADNSINPLASFTDGDLEELKAGMASIDNTSDMHLLVYIDTGFPRLIEIENKGGTVVETIVKEYEDRNSCGVAETQEVFNDVFGNSLYKAESYGLIYWSHGEGWIPTPLPSTRWIGNDKTGGGHYMNIEDLKLVLQNAPHFDFIMFDACFMQSVEVAYELRDCCDYYIGFPAENPGPGAAYDRMFPFIFQKGAAVEMAIGTFAAYDEIYTGKIGSNSNWTMGTAIDVLKSSELENLAAATANALSGVTADREVLRSSVFDYDQRKVGSSYYVGYYDFVEMMEKLVVDEVALDEWKQAYDAASVCWKKTPMIYSMSVGMFSMKRANGVSHYIPSTATSAAAQAANAAYRSTLCAVVVGAGFIGLEMAENLHHAGVHVSVVEMGNQVMAPIDFSMAAPIHQHLLQKGVSLYLEEGVTHFKRTDNGITVFLKSGKAIPADMVLLSIGVRPATALAQQAGLKLGEMGGIWVDEHLETSEKDIYAVGDAIEYPHPLTGKPWLNYLANPANRQGRIVADNMVFGNTVSYEGAIGTSIAKVFDMTVASTGLAAKRLKQWGMEYQSSVTHSASHAGYYPDALPLTLKLTFHPKTGKLYGAQCIGYEGVDKRIDQIAGLIKRGGTVYDLMETEHTYAPPFSSAKDPIAIGGYVASNIISGAMPVISWRELVEEKDKVMLIDTRTPEEFSFGTIPGAVNIPLDEMREHLAEIPTDKPVVLFCAVGLRGYLSLRILMGCGYRNVRNLIGGYKTYSTATAPLPSLSAPAGGGSSSSSVEAATDDVPADASVSKKETLKINACGLQCPGPIMQVKKAMDSIAVGERVEIVATDAGFARDASAWCDTTGNKLIEKHDEKGRYTVVIEKGAPACTSASNVSAAGGRGKTLILFSDDLDKALATFVLANGAAATGQKVTIFFTFWGLNVLKKVQKPSVQKDFFGKMFGMMLPSSSLKLKLSQMNMFGMGSRMMRFLMKRKGVDSLESLRSQALAQGVEFIACQMSMDMMGIQHEELLDEVTIGGVATYMERADKANVNLFI